MDVTSNGGTAVAMPRNFEGRSEAAKDEPGTTQTNIEPSATITASRNAEAGSTVDQHPHTPVQKKETTYAQEEDSPVQDVEAKNSRWKKRRQFHSEQLDRSR